MQDAATVEEKIEKLDPQKNSAPINPKRRTEPMSQILITLTFHIKRPSGMREAVRRPTRDGVLNTEIWNSLALVLDSPAIFGSLYPPIIPPRDPAHSAGPTPNYQAVGAFSH